MKAPVEFKSSVDRLVVLGDVVFLGGDGCVGGTFDMPRAEGTQGGELAPASERRRPHTRLLAAWLRILKNQQLTQDCLSHRLT